MAAKRSSLSLAAARDNARGRLSASASHAVKAKTFALQRTAKPLETWRNRRYAHDDELTATGKNTLPKIQFARIEKCLAQAIEIMELLDPQAATCKYLYDDLDNPGDGNSIKYAIQMAAQYSEECLRKGVQPLSNEAKQRAINDLHRIDRRWRG